MSKKDIAVVSVVAVLGFAALVWVLADHRGSNRAGAFLFAVAFALEERPHVRPYIWFRPTDFFLVQESGGEVLIIEHYVVANAPRNHRRMLEAVAEFNRRTITTDMIENYEFSRHFYRETRWLTRNFRQGEPYPTNWVPIRFVNRDSPGQQLRNHFEDRLIDSRYPIVRDGRPTVLRYRFPQTGEAFERRIPDVHAFFADSEGNLPGNAPRIEFERQ